MIATFYIQMVCDICDKFCWSQLIRNMKATVSVACLVLSRDCVFVVEEQEESNSSSSSSNDDSSSDGEGKPTRSSESDSDATTASYSSLEDDEGDGNQKNDNADAGNGNDCTGATQNMLSIATLIKEMALEPNVNGGCSSQPATFQSTSSDSESPTEPVSQPTIAQLRATVVPSKAK